MTGDFIKRETRPGFREFCSDFRRGQYRGYEGLSADVDKLPKYDGLGTGSSAFCMAGATVVGYVIGEGLADAGNSTPEILGAITDVSEIDQ